MAPETIVVPYDKFNAGTVIRPGDKLVFCTPERLTMAMADEFKSRLNERLPGVEIVIIDNTAGFAVYRPDEETTTPEARDAAERKAARIRGEHP